MREEETWKDFFCRQLSTGRGWQNLYKEEFEEHQFLERSDAVYICKKAQADVYEKLIEHFASICDDGVREEIKLMLTEHWKIDDSALGMIKMRNK